MWSFQIVGVVGAIENHNPKPWNLENNLQLLKRNCHLILKNGMPPWTLKKTKTHVCDVAKGHGNPTL